MPTTLKPKTKLEWRDGRWHLAGRQVHAGEHLELRGYDGKWFAIRVETSDRGQRLIAAVELHRVYFSRVIDPRLDRLRWPN